MNDDRTPPKLAEIASRIRQHLQRLAAKPQGTPVSFFMPNAWAAGSKIGVRYVSYQLDYKLMKKDAWDYLRWLDAGNEGKHHIHCGLTNASGKR